jgi:hypothetical protein
MLDHLCGSSSANLLRRPSPHQPAAPKASIVAVCHRGNSARYYVSDSQMLKLNHRPGGKGTSSGVAEQTTSRAEPRVMAT